MAYLYFIILLATLLVLNKSYFIRWYHLRRIPIVGPRSYLGWLLSLTASRRPYLALGYKEHSQSVYRLRTIDGELLVLPPKYFDELKEVADTKFSFDLNVEILLMFSYTKAYVPIDLVPALIKQFMGPKAGTILPALFEESKYVLETRLPVTEDWTSVKFFKISPYIIGCVSELVIGGPELNRNEEWLQANLDFVVNVVTGAGKIRMVPRILRPLAQYLIHELRFIPKISKTAYRLAAPVIARRVESMKANDVQPNDFMQVMLHRQLPISEADLRYHVHCQLMASLGAIFVTSMTFTQAVYDLAYRPEYIEALRTEARQVLDLDGPITKQKLAQLQKLDSFLQESQRLNPASLTAGRRLCTTAHTFSDGTFIPVGSQVGLPAYDIGLDPSILNAAEFDGFRWYNLRSSSSAHGLDFSSATKTSIHFGFGKHSCGGRFFVADSLKILLALILTTYDLKLKEPEKGRPKNWEVDTAMVPNMEAEILIRRATG